MEERTEHTLEEGLIGWFEECLREEEKSTATIQKYLRDIRALWRFVGEPGKVSKEVVIAYKQALSKQYAPASANSMLAAANHFFQAVGWQDCVVKAFKVQKESFRSGERELSKEEYIRLVDTAERKGRIRLSLVMQTICTTGIRVSELRFITVEALQTRRARVVLKGKARTVILPKELCKRLLLYVKEQQIVSGSVFVTSSGKPLDRSNILHAMKALGKEAGVPKNKLFPHNLRHLFAVEYYDAERDLSHLADLLGHSNINTTRIYTRVSCEEQEARLERLGLVR